MLVCLVCANDADNQSQFPNTYLSAVLKHSCLKCVNTQNVAVYGL